MMKKLRLLALLYLGMALSLCTLAQNKINVNGKILSESGEELSNTTITIENKITKAVTHIISDSSGNFSISIIPDTKYNLLFERIGYNDERLNNYSVLQSENNSLLIRLKASQNSLNEVVVVGYGTQKKVSTTASVSTLKGSALTEKPVANISNALGGQVSGVLTFQGNGAPGADAADVRIRGIGTTGTNSAALVIIDGIPRSYSQIDPNEVENITILKDAAAVAPYGLSGANGVMLVTTKRGKKGKLSLAFNGWYGVQKPTRIPDYLNSYDYATQMNIATKNLNPNSPPPYSDEALQKYKDHSDLDHYPDHDWVHEVINMHAPMHSENLTLTGGSEKIRFFSSLGYLYQEGSVNVINYSRYNIASNVDVDATKTTTVSLDIRATMANTRNPGSIDGTGIYTQITKQPPLLPAQLQFTNGLPGNTLLPSIYESGYTKDNSNAFFSQLAIEQKLTFLQGLAIKGVVAYDKKYSFDKIWQTPYTIYSLNQDNEYIPTPSGVVSPTLSETFSEPVNITLQGYLTYKNKFGLNDINFLAVVEKRNYDYNTFGASRINYQVSLDELNLGSADKNNFDNSGSSEQAKQLGYVYRLGYAYAQKYLLELSGRYDGHYYFAPGKRFSFFPAYSAGWRLSEEPFIKENLKWIDNLKIRGSFGYSGNLAGSPFQYISSYALTNSYIFGNTQVQGVYERPEANPNITWEKAKKLDLGIEGLFFKGALGFEFDVFSERRSNMLVPPSGKVPAEYGIGLSQINGGIMGNKGYDFSINGNHAFLNGLILNGQFNFSYAKNKVIEIFENASTKNNPNRSQTGKPLGTQFGLRAIGLFQSQEEIDNAPKQFGTLRPGDIRYEDIDSNGVINDNDQVVIGDPAFPQIMYGFSIGSSWKGIDISMLWQGAGESSFQLTNEAALPFFNGAKIFKEQLDYWTPDNTNASYPILLPAPSTNNQQVSSWWQHSGSYLRLKNVEIGYSLPAGFMHKLSIHSIRIFSSAQNLLTFNKIKFIDPEVGVSSGSKRARYYFQQKVLSFGINVNF